MIDILYMSSVMELNLRMRQTLFFGLKKIIPCMVANTTATKVAYYSVSLPRHMLVAWRSYFSVCSPDTGIPAHEKIKN